MGRGQLQQEDSDAQIRRSDWFGGWARGTGHGGERRVSQDDFGSAEQQQVASVCGKNAQTGGGHTGCTKSCGGGTQVCDFDCNNKSGKCTGSCVTCAQRKFPFGENFPTHVVKKDVRVAR